MSNAVHQAVNEVHKLPKAEEKQSDKERTYQWLHTQAVHPNTDSAGTGRWDTLLWTIFFWKIYTDEDKLLTVHNGDQL